MKKFIFFAACAILALPVTTSCGGPSGKPKKDAESLKELYEKLAQDSLELKEKEIEILEYYASKKDKAAYDEFKNQQVPFAVKDAANEFEKKHREKIIELNNREKDALEKINDAPAAKDGESQTSQKTSN